MFEKTNCMLMMSKTYYQKSCYYVALNLFIEV